MKKYILFILLVILQICIVNGTTYYFSNSGNDNNNGLSEEYPKQTITELNSLTLYPNDFVLLNRGDMWRFPIDDYLIPTSGSSVGYVNYSAYGTGAKPLFLGSFEANGAGNWTFLGNNIWQLNTYAPKDIGTIIFNNETIVGFKKPNMGNVTTQGDFWYNISGNNINLYSISIPSSYYTDIELGERERMINFNEKSYLIFENLDLRYGGMHGVTGENSEWIIVQDCVFAYIGGSYHHDTLRYGNSIEFSLGSNHVLITRNIVYGCYDAAISPQAWDNGNQYLIANHIVTDNICYDNYFSYEYFNTDTYMNSRTENITIENNTFINANGWSASQRDDSGYAQHFRMARTPVNTKNIIIRYNVVINASYREFEIGMGTTDRWAGDDIIFDYNYYYFDAISDMFRWSDGTKYDSLAALNAGTGVEAHGVEGTPTFYNYAEKDFRPIIGSTICNMSPTGSYIGALPCVDAPSGTTYYFSNSGNDNNDGLSEEYPKQTITELNSLTLYPNDFVLLNRGDMWRCEGRAYCINLTSGNSFGNITYNAYGIGNNPIISGSVAKNKTSDWIYKGDSIYWSLDSYDKDIGNIILDFDTVGIKCNESRQVDSNLKFWRNTTSGKIVLYLNDNPANIYNSIEVVQKTYIIYGYNDDYVNIFNLTLRNAGYAGIMTIGEQGQSSDYITIKDCEVYMIGGIFEKGSTSIRTGNCIGSPLNTSHITITDNIVHDCYDTGISFQAWSNTGSCEKSNHYYARNIMYGNYYNFEYFNADTLSGSKTENITIEYNTFVNAHGWSHDQRPDLNMSQNMRLARTGINTHNFVIQHNVFVNASFREIEFGMGTTNRWAGDSPIMDYNFYNHTSNYEMIRWVNGIKYANIINFNIGTGNEANGLEGNPMFVDINNNDFRPLSTSIICNMSPTGSYIGALPCFINSTINVIQNSTCIKNCLDSKNIVWQQFPLKNDWQKTQGLQGGEGMQMVFDIDWNKNNINILYLVSDTTQVWKSINKGNSWFPIGFNIPIKGGSSIVSDPNNENIVFMSGSKMGSGIESEDEGIYRTLDGGSNWKKVSDTIHFKREHHGKLFLINDNIIYAGTPNGILKSVDRGNNWTTIALSDNLVYSLNWHKTNKSYIFISTENGFYKLNVLNNQITTLGNGLLSHPWDIAISNNINIIYAATNNGIYKSIDGGINFNSINNGLQSDISYRYITISENKLFASPNLVGGYIPYWSNNSGESWNKINDYNYEEYLKGGYYYAKPVIFNPNNSSIAIFQTGGPIVKTFDSGKTWHYSSDGYTGARVVDISFIEKDKMIFCLTDYALLLTENNGDSFTFLDLPRVDNAQSCGSADMFGDIIIASSGGWDNQNIFRSINKGLNWTNVNSISKNFKFIRFNSYNKNIVYADNLISKDMGQTWDIVNDDYEIRAMHINNGNIIYGFKYINNKYIIGISYDAGDSWTQIGNNIIMTNGSLRDIAVDPFDNQHILIASGGYGIYEYKDNVWYLRKGENGLPQWNSSNYVFVKFDPNIKGIAWTGKQGYKNHGTGVYLSLDGGTNWLNQINNLGTYNDIYNLEINPYDNTIYLTGPGVWNTSFQSICNNCYSENNKSKIYYVSNSGNDNNDGLSKLYPIKTIKKVNTLSLNPSDKVLFKRDNVWRMPNDAYIKIVSEKNITYGAYGIGNKPLFLGSVNLKNKSDWFFINSGIWESKEYTTNKVELLQNPNFETNLNNWVLYIDSNLKANTTMINYNNSLKLNIIDSGVSNSNIQLYTYGINLKENNYYKLSFLIKSNNSFVFENNIKIMKYYSPWTAYYNRKSNSNFYIDSIWRNYTVYFKSNYNDNNTRLNFCFGNIVPNNTEIYIDTLSFQKINNSDILFDDVGSLIFNNETNVGFKKQSVKNFTAQGDFTYNITTWKIKIKSIMNPALYYFDIKAALKPEIFEFTDMKDIIFENFDVRYSGRGAFSGENIKNIIIQDCNIAYIGGSYLINTDRFGNGIGFGLNSDQILVTRNNVTQCYDAGISPQAWNIGKGSIITNQIYSYNTVSYCQYGFEKFNSIIDNGASTENITIIQNTIINSGKEWSANQRADGNYARSILLSRTPNATSNIIIRDNILYNASYRLLDVGRGLPNWWLGDTPNINYNLYFTEGTNFIYWNGNSYNNLLTFQNAENKDLNSLETDPLFINIIENNFQSYYGSPICNMSSTGSYIGSLPCIKYKSIVYYVSNSGNDNNDGLSKLYPIKTIKKVNTLSLNPSDKVLFKRDNIWRMPNDEYIDLKSGNNLGHITYGSYEIGNKSLFLGSINSTNTNDWIFINNNIWMYNKTINLDIGNLIFNNISSFGIKNWSIAEIINGGQGYYYYNITTQNLFLYSSINPITYYNNIEIVLKKTLFDINNVHYIILENLSMKYGAAHGIDGANNYKIIIRDCNISYIGGGQHGTIPTRYGNGIQFWRGAHDNIVKNNKIWECYDAAITNQASSGTNFNTYNITYDYNTIWNSAYGYEYFQADLESTTKNIIIDHNTFYNLGEGWYKTQRISTAHGNCIRVGTVYGSSQINITNNICYKSDEYVYRFSSIIDGWKGNKNITINNNLLYRNISTGRTNKVIWFAPLSKFYSTFNEWQIDTMKDNNSLFGDPLFVNVTTNDFRLLSNSPACNMSSTGSYVGSLPCINKNDNIGSDSLIIYINQSHPNCNDSYTKIIASNISSPWCSLSINNLAKLISGDIVIIEEGEYNGEFILQDKTINKNITIKAYKQVNFTRYIKNYSLINNNLWININNNIWYTNITLETAVFMKEYATVYLKNMTKFFTWRDYEKFSNSNYAYNTYTNKTARLVYVKFNNININPNNISLYLNTEYNTLYLRDNIMNNNSYIIISNITFKYHRHGIRIRNQSNILIENCKFYGGHDAIDGNNLDIKKHSNLIFKNNYFNGLRGLEWWGQDMKEQGSEETTGLHIVNHWGPVYVYNNIFEYWHGSILLGANEPGEFNNSLIYNNLMTEGVGSQLEIENYCSNSKWFNNIIYNSEFGVSFAPADARDSKTPCEFYNNTIIVNRPHRWSLGAATSNSYSIKGDYREGTNTSNWKIYQNTFYGWGMALYGIDLNSYENINFTNNIFVAERDTILYRTGTSNSKMFFDYNLYYTNETTIFAKNWNIGTGSNFYNTLIDAKVSDDWDNKWDINSIESNPLFANVTTNDFRLLSNSPACNMSSTGSYVGSLPCIKNNVSNLINEPLGGPPNVTTTTFYIVSSGDGNGTTTTTIIESTTKKDLSIIQKIIFAGLGILALSIIAVVGITLITGTLDIVIVISLVSLSVVIVLAFLILTTLYSIIT